MVNKCAAPNCSVRYHLSSFHFPKDKEMYDRWKKAVPRDNWVPTANSVLCEKHFLPTDFKEERVDVNKARKRCRGVALNRKFLKPNAFSEVLDE